VFAKINEGVLPVYWREINVEELRREVLHGEEKLQDKQEGRVPFESDERMIIEDELYND
jgi:hypothetical protein